jgi:phosphoglucomutase
LGKLSGKEFIVKTIVTTELMARIAEDFKVKWYNCYTGFKYIAEEVKKHEDNGKGIFIAGGEESFGFNVGSLVRDKDSIISAALAAEVLAWAKELNMTMLDLLNHIYVKYGYFKEKQISVTKKGKEGAEAIQQLMRDFRTSPPKSLGGSPVKEIYDYQSLEVLDVPNNGKRKIDQKTTSNVLQWLTQDGTIISVRPSGTEPKIKFYFGVCESLKSAADVDKLSTDMDKKIDAIAKELRLV